LRSLCLTQRTQSPRRPEGISSRSYRGVRSDLCVRKPSSGFGCGSAALGLRGEDFEPRRGANRREGRTMNHFPSPINHSPLTIPPFTMNHAPHNHSPFNHPLLTDAAFNHEPSTIIPLPS
jgi:hypothetical protein